MKAEDIIPWRWMIKNNIVIYYSSVLGDTNKINYLKQGGNKDVKDSYQK